MAKHFFQWIPEKQGERSNEIYISNGVLSSLQKEGIPVISDNINELEVQWHCELTSFVYLYNLPSPKKEE